MRIARKTAIKTIQDTISILENKVPLPQEESIGNLTEAVPVENETSSETDKMEYNN